MLIKGFNSLGREIILFINISFTKNYLTAFEKYKQAGFKNPKYVIVDSKKNIHEALMTKLALNPS